VDTPLTVTGKMQKLSRDKKPVVGLQRTTDLPHGVISREHLQDKIMQDRQTLLTTMRNSGQADPEGRRSLIVSTVARIAQEQEKLLQTIKQDAASLTGGTEINGPISKVLGTQMFNNRMQSATQAMSRFTELTDKLVQKEVIENTIIKQVRPSFEALMKRGNEGDFAAWASGFNALQGGWFVKAGTKVHQQHPGVGDIGKLPGRVNHQFILEQSAENREMWRKRFGEEMPADALLPVSKVDKRPVTITENAMQALKSVDRMQQQILTEENALRAAKNQPAKPRKKWHMPVPNLEGQHMTYIMDLNDNILQAVAGATPKQSRSLANQAARQYKVAVNVVGEDSVSAHVRAKGRSFQDITDLSSPEKQTGASKGSLASPIVTTDPKQLNHIVDKMIADMSNIVRRSRVEIVKPELDLAEFQKVASTVGRDIGKEKTDTVWDAFRFEALGVQK